MIIKKESILIFCLFFLNSNLNSSQNPLNKAINFGSIQLIDQVLKKDPLLIDKVNEYGQTSLLCATFNSILIPGKYVSIVKHLITKHKANLNIPNDHGYTPLLLLQTYDGTSELVNFFIENGANVDTPNHHEITPLMMASFQQNPEHTKILISRKASTRTFDNSGNNALILAIALDRVETVKILLESGSEINRTDFNGNNALMIAAECGSFECVKLLIEQGINKYQKNKKGEDALEIAIKRKQFEIAKYLHKSMR